MNQIAYFYGNTVISWNSVIMALAVMVGISFFLAAWMRSREHFLVGVLIVPVVIWLSLYLGRYCHWYFQPDSYESLAAAMSDLSGGGHALMGAFAACAITAAVLKLLRIVNDLPVLLDSMCVGGCAAIALGRLSCLFSGENRGDILTGVTQLPWAAPVVNVTSGAVEYRLAVFFLQAMVTAVIFLAVLWMFYKKRRDGDVTLVFLLLYCASQAVLDSARYDALRLQGNGSISAVQVLCAVTLVAVVGILFWRLVKKTGFQRSYLTVWAAMMVSLAGTGGMEYAVRSNGGKALWGYLTMGGFMLLAVAVGLILLYLTGRETVPVEAPAENQEAKDGQ